MILNIILALFWVGLAYALLQALRKGSIDMAYGSLFNPKYKDDPVGFAAIFGMVFLVWIVFGYFLIIRLS